MVDEKEGECGEEEGTTEAAEGGHLVLGVELGW